MKRRNGMNAPWVLPWHYLTEAHALDWRLSGWLYGGLLGAAFLFGLSLGFLLGNPWLGWMMAVFFAYFIPGEWLERVRRQKQRKARTAWLEAVRILRTSYMVCGAWRQALVMSLPHLPEEARSFVKQALEKEQAGDSLDRAMKQSTWPLPEMFLFPEIAGLLDTVGGPSGETLLEDVMEELEEASHRAEELEQETAARQTETRHLFGLFLVELLFFRIIGSAYFTGLFHSSAGQWWMSGLFGMNAGCLVWVRLRMKRWNTN